MLVECTTRDIHVQSKTVAACDVGAAQETFPDSCETPEVYTYTFLCIFKVLRRNLYIEINLHIVHDCE